MKDWDCKVVLPDDAKLPDGADQPMREAVRGAVEKMTGRIPTGIFSGWGGRLTALELEIIGRKADVNTDTNDKSKETVDWPDGFIAEILALLDRIEIKDDAELASQRHDIAEKYGMTVVLGVQTSRYDN